MRRHTDYQDMVAVYHLLSPAERKELDAHVGVCAACQTDLVAYQQMDADLRGLRPHSVSAALTARVSAAVSGASVATEPQLARSAVREPVLRRPKRARQP